MQPASSEEHITSANASPRMAHKSASSLFGLFTKRSTKIEPHHNDDQLVSATEATKEHDVSFAKCSPDKKTITSVESSVIAANHLNNNVTTSQKSLRRAKVKSLTLPPASGPNNNFEKSYSSGFLSLQRRLKSTASKCNKSSNRRSADGSQSDGGEVTLRTKSPKHRSPNHNRFSHQFSLCCKVERKPTTPPVTVRYISLAEAGNAIKGDTLSHTWSMTPDDASLSFNTADVVAATVDTAICLPPPLQVPSISAAITVCSSAPQSPVTAKAMIVPPNTSSHSSPSNSSLKSTQSDTQNSTLTTVRGAGPIRPIAVTACRSRLRLKLLPPGKEMPKQLPETHVAPQQVSDAKRRATTPQHMSSPNIATSPAEAHSGNTNPGVRFLSHENIQMQKHRPQGGGLAMQALMAAQVLSLIPTEKARERSFISGHLGPTTLMGPSELNRILPTKEVTIFVGTWNMNGQSPPKQMNDFVLPTTVEHVPDIVAIGTQESSPDRFEWEVTIQETLGPSHVLFHATTLGTLHLAIYIRRDLIWYCSAPEDASLSVRTGSAFRTKGAVAISFCLFGTSMLFVTSHLTAHQQKVKERVSDVKRIIHALDLPKNLLLRHKNKDVTQNFDNVFWCGDLNFRLGEPREKLLEWIQHTKFPLPSHLPHGYMHTDQLSSVLADGAAFHGFMEANITFPPTYKYDPGTQYFDTSSKQRAPAYTDRILYKFRQPQGSARRQSSAPGGVTNTQPCVQCLLYDSVPSIITSDHKPVLALFRVLIRAGTDSLPLAAGLFHRDIYLEGMKRRLNNQYSDSSAVCSIQ